MKSKRLISAFLSCLLAITSIAQASETHKRLTNLPHIYINTFSGNSITSKTTYVLAKMWYVDENDSVAVFDSLQIRGRGNSTWGMAKKPYRLKFNQKEKLLGKGYAKTKNWTLLANHGDKSLIRNALTRQLGERLGLKFNPAAKFVDLTLNDEYVGNYQLSDHIDVRPHRVNITEQDLPLTDESNITGGYLLEVDGFKDFENGRTGFYSPQYNVPIRIHYPDNDDIITAQYIYIRDFITNFENQLFSNNFKEELSYRSNIDSTSLANWYLATEISGNIDGFFSTYFYKEQDDDHLYWGPLWDYDIAYANDNRKGDTSRQLMRDVAFGSDNLRTWIIRLWQAPWFTSLIARRYSKAVNEGLEDYMLQQIDSLATLLDSSQQLNYQRWGISQRTLRECVLYSTYSQYISDLKKYVKNHIAYLSEVLNVYVPDEPTPIVPDFESDTLVYYAISNSGTGTCIDVNTNNKACANQRDEDSESQQWRIIPLSNGYFHILNHMTGMALNDPTEGEPTATTLTGTQLDIAEADSTDIRQQWDIVKQDGNRFNLINAFSHHGANLSGGNSANGTSILSYTSDSRDATSNNRMWYIEPVADYTDAIETIGDIDYALAYNPVADRLHFGSDNISALSFAVRLYDQSGRLLRTFRASDGCSMTSLPHGLYIVTWKFEGRTHSIKFTK